MALVGSLTGRLEGQCCPTAGGKAADKREGSCEGLPHASVVKASSCGPSRCAALAGSIACGARLGRGGQLRAPLLPLVGYRGRRERPTGGFTPVLHQGCRGASATRGEPLAGGRWGSGRSGGPRAWRRQHGQGRHASGHSMGCTRRCDSCRRQRLPEEGRPCTTLRT